MLEAHIKIIEKEPKTFQNFGVLKALAQENDEESLKNKDEPPASEPLKLNDDDQKLFFGEEFSDRAENDNKKIESEDNKQQQQEKSSDKLIDYDDGFNEFMSSSSSVLLPSQLLMDDSFPTNVDLLGSLVPSQVSDSSTKDDNNSLSKNASKKSNDVSKWFQLFAELDPFNQQKEVKDASENMHAA